MRTTLLFAFVALGCQGEARRPAAPRPPPPTPSSAPQTATEDRRGIVGLRYVTLLRDERWDEAVDLHDDGMARALPPEKLRALWESLCAKLGPPRSIVLTRVETGPDRAVVAATFGTTTVGLSVNLDAHTKVTGFFVVPLTSEPTWVAPRYATPESFRETEVSFGAAPFVLPATLTMPKKAAPARAIVLVHGSGPNDRDETDSGGTRAFKDLAWGLATRGIAVLRYEKVTRAHGKAWLEKWGDDVTLDRETTDDAVAALAWLRKQPAIDPARVVVLGHSQGGLAAPRIAKADPAVAGVIAFAAPTRRFEDICLDQYAYVATMPGAVGEKIRAELPAMRAAVQRVKSTDLGPSTPKDLLPFAIPAAFWLDLRGYRPEALAAKLGKPILVLQGEADYQVTMEDFAGWKRGLAGKPFATFRSWPHVKHDFSDCGCDKAKPDDAPAASHVAEEVVDTIATWVDAL